jgi:hypothetical protein
MSLRKIVLGLLVASAALILSGCHFGLGHGHGHHGYHNGYHHGYHGHHAGPHCNYCR